MVTGGISGDGELNINEEEDGSDHNRGRVQYLHSNERGEEKKSRRKKIYRKQRTGEVGVEGDMEK
jgi:hypothetical protein